MGRMVGRVEEVEGKKEMCKNAIAGPDSDYRAALVIWIIDSGGFCF